MTEKVKYQLWVARAKDNSLYLYESKPYKEGKYWEREYGSSIFYNELNPEMFPSVKWEDDEPTRIEIAIVE